MTLLSGTPADLITRLRALDTRRAYVVTENGQTRASHPELAELAVAIAENTRDYRAHEGVFLEIGNETGALLGAFVHKTVRGQAAGGVRYWRYDRLEHYLSDGLRLAVGMGRKNAAAGLWWGGGKGVIARADDHAADDPKFRRALFREYGRFLSGLNGCYVSAEDAGAGPFDMAEIFTTTRYITCVPPAVGGSGNPSFATARGVVAAMQGATAELGMTDLRGKRIVMQGIGNVGGPMVGELLDAGVESVVATDIDAGRVNNVMNAYAGRSVTARVVDGGDMSIYEEKGDIFVPNALGGGLNPDTIARLKVSIVCGAANNQLLDDQRDDRLLAERGITYVPDFIANRMGIVNCANEQYGRLPNDPAIERHFDAEWDNSVANVVRRVLRSAKADGITTSQAANRLADELAEQPHPIWGHRAQAIISSLVANHWEKGESDPYPTQT